jgi:hypothetical protein
MKFLHVTYHFEYADAIEEILDRHDIENFTRYSMMEGRDSDGKHFGTQVYPGNVSVVQAQVPEGILDDLMQSLRDFRDAEASHNHLEAVVLPIERRL